MAWTEVDYSETLSDIAYDVDDVRIYLVSVYVLVLVLVLVMIPCDSQ